MGFGSDTADATLLLLYQTMEILLDVYFIFGFNYVYHLFYYPFYGSLFVVQSSLFVVAHTKWIHCYNDAESSDMQKWKQHTTRRTRPHASLNSLKDQPKTKQNKKTSSPVIPINKRDEQETFREHEFFHLNISARMNAVQFRLSLMLLWIWN